MTHAATTPMPQPATSRCDLLLTGGVVLTLDDARRVLDPGAVAITGNRIADVGQAADLAHYQAARRVDCTGTAVLPGLVDTHTHLFQALARGLGDGLSLWPWLCEFMWPYAATINQDDAEVAAQLGAVEAVRAGTTCILDNHYAPADSDTTVAVGRAIQAVGLRGRVARGIFGQITEVARAHGLAASLFRFSDSEELDVTRDCLAAFPPGGLVGVWPGPVNVIYVGQQLLARSVELARTAGTGWHAHCSEARADPQIYLDAYGIRPIRWLHDQGLLGPEATIAHGIWLDDAEVQHLGETGSGVAYSPVSNQYLASGVPRLRDLRAAGAVVGLGSDGPGCGHRQDLFEAAKQAILLQRVHTLDPAVSDAAEALELATREGARMLGVDAGVIAPGRLADVAVVDLRRPHLTPCHDPAATLAYSARGSDVTMTIVDGQVVYQDGRCLLADEDALMAEAQTRAAHLARRAGITPRRPATAHPATTGDPRGCRG